MLPGDTIITNLDRARSLAGRSLLLTEISVPAIVPLFDRRRDCRTGKEGDVSNSERVLVVDDVTDTAEVLRAVLEPRGLTVKRVSRLDHSPAPSIETRPAVVVLDAETCNGANCPSWEGWQSVPQVIIGTVRLAAAGTTGIADPTADRRYLEKPFQFADLIQAIEALIAESTRG